MECFGGWNIFEILTHHRVVRRVILDRERERERARERARGEIERGARKKRERRER